MAEQIEQQRYPGCLFIAACSFYPETTHPIHQLADRQKQASYRYTRALLVEMEADDPSMVAQQMELVLEGCLSKLLVKHDSAGCGGGAPLGGRYFTFGAVPEKRRLKLNFPRFA